MIVDDELPSRDVDQLGRERRLYGPEDQPWIAIVADHAVEACGQPWRALRDGLEHAPISPGRVTAILRALRRITGGGKVRASVARRVRAAVLGLPALDDATRATRLDAVAQSMGVVREDVEGLLWLDLAEERPVTLPDGRPDERTLAAYANLDRLQRLVRRARTLRLRIWGDAAPLVRAAARYGLLATVTVTGDATVLDVAGPLSLFHKTTVYGRALAQLVPLLADVPRFVLELAVELERGPAMFTFASPVLLPPVPLSRLAAGPTARLARELRELALVDVDPPPIAHGADRLYPDLLVEHAGRRHTVELVGFATADYLAAKLARYRAAGVPDVVLCVDDARAADASSTDDAVLRYTRRLTAPALLAHLARRS
jgi:predicted nuclease of restriction endonuclease-like RecB superfamily